MKYLLARNILTVSFIMTSILSMSLPSTADTSEQSQRQYWEKQQNEREYGGPDNPGSVRRRSRDRILPLPIVVKVKQKDPDPKLVEYLNSGMTKSEANDFNGALADYNKAIDLDPKFVRGYYERGVLKERKLNDPKGALADYDKAIDLDPNYVIAYNNRSVLRFQSFSDLKGALADIRKSIELYRSQGNEAGLQQATEGLKFLESQ
jgi:tetratricopeptide (TPR) repeat protein